MLNEERITYRMVNLIESGFFGKNKSLLTEAFADRDKVRIFQAAYNYTYDKNLAVDGIKGTQTNAAIDEVKKALGKEKLDDTNTADFYYKFLERLQNDKSINVGQGGANTNKNLNYAIQVLINLAGKPLGIDSVIGTKTNTAIKELTNSDTITSQNILPIINLANPNVKTLGVEGIATVQGKTRDQVTAESRKAWEKYPCIVNADGVKEEILSDGSIRYTDKANANVYFANGRKMRISDSVKDDYYCNGMQVVIGVMQKSNTNAQTEGTCVEGNCVNGQGKFVKPNKDEYVGTFVNGKLTGENNKIFYYEKGDYFEGITKDNVEVKGIMRYRDSSLYTGYFLNGKFHGNNSSYMSPTGKKWKGNFRNGKPDGSTWKELDNPLLKDDGKETVFPVQTSSVSARGTTSSNYREMGPKY